MRYVSMTVLMLGLLLLCSRASAQANDDLRLADNAAIQYWQAFALMPTLNEEQKKLLENWRTAPLDAAALELIEQSRNSVMYLHRGAKLADCDWGLDYNDGISLMLPHLAKARDLARLAALHGRQNFEQGNRNAARANAMSITILARHVGRDPILICTLVRYLIEDITVDLVAPYVLDLKASHAKSVQMFDNLPRAATLGESLVSEKKYMGEWLVRKLRDEEKQNPGSGLKLWKTVFETSEIPESIRNIENIDEAIKHTEQVLPLYEELAKYVQLPRNEFEAQYPKFKQETESALPLAGALLPAIDKMMAQQQRNEARFTMLLAALAVAESGPEKLAEIKDPFGDGPFEYHKLDNGFELKSKLTFEGEPVAVTFGQRKE